MFKNIINYSILVTLKLHWVFELSQLGVEIKRLPVKFRIVVGAEQNFNMRHGYIWGKRKLESGLVIPFSILWHFASC